MRPVLLLAVSALLACAKPAAPEPTPEVAPPDRATFNRLARNLDIPVFWRHDGEMVPFMSTSPWKGSRDEAKAAIEARHRTGVDTSALSPEEQTRRALVLAELDAGRTTLLETDLSAESDGVKAFVGHMMHAAKGIDRLYSLQRGAAALADGIPADDPASRSLFERNHGPWCEAPASDDPACSAIPGAPGRVSGLYPADVQTEGFCERLAEQDLMSPFTVVSRVDGELVTVPYVEAWPEEMAALSTHLGRAADALETEDEPALVAYLRAAAAAFTTNDWFAADVAWAAMNQTNSRWYVRVAPDETYFEPCSRHAGFALVLSLIDPGGLAMQAKLEPVKSDLEGALADLAGPPYHAREVGFDLPEFIRIVLNAGDSRDAFGATIGQSLPNWGPVSDAGGRTVAMTNLFTDPDSVVARRATSESLLCDASLVVDDPEPLLISTVLHEAAHNLGPAGEYRVDGETDEQRFGGPMASMLEELKAQTSALYFTDWLASRGLIEPEMAPKMHAADITWALGQVSRGMYTSTGTWRAYGQLSMIQIGFLMDQGAVGWHRARFAANGTDLGCLSINSELMPAAVDALAHEVLRIKGAGDAEAANLLKARYVDTNGELEDLRGVVAERYGREPRASFVYRVIR